MMFMESQKIVEERIDIWSSISIKYSMTDNFQIQGIYAH